MTKLKLLKYPIMTISVVVGLILARWSLDIDFSRMTKIGPQGMEFDNNTRESAVGVTSELDAKLKELSLRIETLEGKTDSVDVKSQTTAKLNEVSDQVSQLSMSQSKFTKTVFSGRKGHIFIGQYDSTAGWNQAVFLIQDSGQPVTSAPEQLPVGGRFLVRTNMVLRDGLPSNDAEYFRGKENIGVIPRGTLVALLGQPAGIDRKFAVEYWAPVQVLE